MVLYEVYHGIGILNFGGLSYCCALSERSDALRLVRCAQRGWRCTVFLRAHVLTCTQHRFWSEEKGLSPGPEAWLSRAGSQCLRHWERWLSPARRQVAVHVRSVRLAHVDPKLLGSSKSQGFRRPLEGCCQARAPFAASLPVGRSSSKVVLYSQLGGKGSAYLRSPS